VPSDATGNTSTGTGALAVDIGSGRYDYGTAIGFNALARNQGVGNTAVGYQSLSQNQYGQANSACGVNAAANIPNGVYNTSIGYNSMLYNQSGGDGGGIQENTAVGAFALDIVSSPTSGNGGSYNNTAIGFAALASNGGGTWNTAIGSQAGSNVSGGNYNIYLGSLGVAGDYNVMRLGLGASTARTFVSGVNGVTTSGPASPVYIDANGQLGTAGAGGFTNLASGNAFLRDAAGAVIGSVQSPLPDGTSRVLITVNSQLFLAPYAMSGFISGRGVLFYPTVDCTGSSYVQWDSASGYFNAPIFLGATPKVAYITNAPPQSMQMSSSATPSGSCIQSTVTGYFSVMSGTVDLGSYVPPFSVR
jgi:hypothetical protein